MAASADPLLRYLEQRLGRGDGFGAERHFACPFCLERVGSDSTKKKLDINIANTVVGCYRCGYVGSLTKMFRDLNPTGRLTMEEMRLLRKEKTRDPSLSPSAAVRASLRGKVEVPRAVKKSVPLPPEYVAITPNAGKMVVAPAIAYLNKRGMGPELWDRYKIGYAREGRYAGYLIFPITQDGEVRYFTTRYAGEGRVKTLNPKADEAGEYVTKDDVLLGFDYCKGAKQVALTEGPTSSMAFEYSVAGLGKEYTDHQVELVRSLVHYGLEEAMVAFDDDAVGKAQAMVGRLTGFVPKVSIIVFPKGDPWNNRESIAEFIANRSANAGFSAMVRSRLRVG